METTNAIADTTTNNNNNNEEINKVEKDINNEQPITTTTTTTNTDLNENKQEESTDKIHVPNSTLFSLVLFNLPKYMDLKKFNKFLEQNKVPYKKTKKIVKESFGVISFDSVEVRDKFLEKLNGFEMGTKKLKCEIKEEKADRMKRKFNEQNDDRESKLKTIEEIVCPWYNIPYEEQLQKKKEQIINILINIKSETRKDSLHNLPFWLERRDKTREEKMCCPLEEIIASPTIQNYRNKAQYTIGLDENNVPCVGFALGRTGNGVTIVADPSNAPLISTRSNEIRRLFNDYIISHPRKPFDKNTHEGFWRQLTVRDFSTGESMATVQFNHKGLSEEEINKEKDNLKKFFESLPADKQLTSLSIQLYDGISNAAPVDLPTETIMGPNYIHEKLLGYTFRVSPNAFFQVNTKATELLYSKVLEWAGVSENTHLLDVCCGTGTIGQCASKKVKCITGLEISPDAITDSISNAQLNNITNAEYTLGKAEDTLPSMLTKFSKDEEFIGIVDPPRSGLHNDVLKAIRSFEPMKKLVYVSCNQKSLVQDSIKLCKGISKAMKGTPFIPTKAIAFDLFPHTDLVELVVLFERYNEDSDKKLNKEDGEIQEANSKNNNNNNKDINEDDKKRKREDDGNTNNNENNENNSNKEIKLE
ncbi:hypothetical protein DICPUDRAFT_94161 [Dictyostelium purpureum]|uniref:RRM domain-containing protein n=1 Tax=Dictyostelium purpureum TaxID=5786 RepID=F0ZG81_DICPU|nr:uncharacterized protein DICPUDRAFT_94161 [Dictyostelium purpureum]EGC37059.1 hypothetical protein DICPUDRAFT_94161 [Dictyostelium purpureum]|eukprot:XP_003286416.1 hypothetical protein DICPUDRAFT_94161 [Dictyostelium purpureum]